MLARRSLSFGAALMVRSLVLLETDPLLLGTKPTDQLRPYVSVE